MAISKTTDVYSTPRRSDAAAAAAVANPWQRIKSRIERRFRTIQMGSHLAGVGVCVTYFTFFDDIRTVMVSDSQYLYTMALVTALLFLIGFYVNHQLHKPVMRYISLRASGQTPAINATLSAQRRLLNIPLIAGMVGLINWGAAAIAIPLILIYISPVVPPGGRLLNFFWVFTGIILSGVVTSVLVYFGQEISVRRLLSAFFPEGGVAEITGVFRVNLRARVLVFFFLGGLLPMMDMAFLVYNKSRLVLSHDPHMVLNELRALLIFTLLVEGTLTLVLAHFLTRSIVQPVHRLQEAMSRVAAGDLSVRAKLYDNNELGRLGDNFNRMTAGLRERYELRRTIALAREVQQTLLPRRAPRLPGLDIHGNSIYCDATGGDYWDYLRVDTGTDGPIGIAVGDVSGHGLPSALLMASVRAGLRQRVALGGDIAAIITDVNRQFSRDAERSGNFMTLFYLLIDRPAGRLEWVRAGHDPALLYDPKQDRCDELKGHGMALGVDAKGVYKAFQHEDLREGQVILLGTDGIWEARRSTGEMLGKAPVRQLLREQAHRPAEAIVTALTDLVQAFVGAGRLEDDLTMVVVKVVSNQETHQNSTST
jgi:sigma-B regulation protein RsbU (phosphoserine phosphatase)